MADLANPLDPAPDAPEFFLYHRGGPWLRGTFGCANDAWTWMRGNAGQRYADMFFITDRDGKTVTFEMNRHGDLMHDLLSAVWQDSELAAGDSPLERFKGRELIGWYQGRDTAVEYIRTESIDPLRIMIDAGEYDAREGATDAE